MHLVKILNPSHPDQPLTQVIVIQMEADMTELIGQMRVSLEWVQPQTPVTGTQMEAGFN